MVKHFFPHFLENAEEYALAERFWVDLWQQIDPNLRSRHGWEHPWFQPLPPSLSEGNPIFSAVSPQLKRGIRIIQSAPTEQALEFVAYLDAFGGSLSDPDSIRELVISCALSDLAADTAHSLFRPWIEGEDVSLELPDSAFVEKTQMADSSEKMVSLSEPIG